MPSGEGGNHPIYLTPEGQIALPAPGIDFTAIDRLMLVACGTAFYACNVAKYWFEQVARLPVEIDVASEYRYREPPVPARSAALFVSQSGETADTLAALRYAKGRADSILSVVNVIESSIARDSDLALPILADAEIGVASTKAFTCQLLVLGPWRSRRRGSAARSTRPNSPRMSAACANCPG